MNESKKINKVLEATGLLNRKSVNEGSVEQYGEQLRSELHSLANNANECANQLKTVMYGQLERNDRDELSKRSKIIFDLLKSISDEATKIQDHGKGLWTELSGEISKK